ncbi:hypothetical protein M407DRAFT_18378 [Tulasnella calospora MUT 4182]|uniref:C2H2-type domain-containing protein n=1 Tax=Tulasnella calospora MUT 4182 TaxID=1051891 RepID=A0A0C3QJS2_9AGAM|nr:hypothetical protein M407DRAFT_18378 [Tulasnella calospora MUT 4182]
MPACSECGKILATPASLNIHNNSQYVLLVSGDIINADVSTHEGIPEINGIHANVDDSFSILQPGRDVVLSIPDHSGAQSSAAFTSIGAKIRSCSICGVDTGSCRDSRS